jgi:hypothetical protein
MLPPNWRPYALAIGIGIAAAALCAAVGALITHHNGALQFG